MTLRTSYAVTAGRAPILHRAFLHAQLTVCGYRIARRPTASEGRVDCPRCKGYLK